MDEEELREKFEHIDRHRDGRLDVSEFGELMNALDALEPGESAALGFEAIDTDGSGLVEFDEFARWFSQR